MTPHTRRDDPPQYTPDADRPPTLFGMPRRMLVSRVLPMLLVGFVVWLITTAKANYAQTLTDPSLPQSRFVNESLRIEKRRADFYSQQRVDSVISDERYRRINERFDLIDHKLDCLSHPRSPGC